MAKRQNTETSVSTTPATSEPDDGFILAPPLVPIGTQVEPRNGSVLRARKQWDDLPLLTDAVHELVTHVQDEQRTDEVIPLSDLSMDEHGHLVVHDQAVGLEPNGFRQLCTKARIPGGSAYLVACPPALRATNLNHWVGRTDRQMSEGRRASPLKVKLRMRHLSDTPSVFACVSPSYAAYDVPELLAEALTMLPADARVEASYDGLAMRFRVVFDVEVATAKKQGDVFRAGVEIASADDGTRALHVSAVFWRVACTNLMLFSIDKGSTRKRIHKGSVAEMAAALFMGIREARTVIDPFQDAWNQARKHKVVPKDGNRIQLLEMLFDKKLLQTPGVRSSIAINLLLSAWDQEPGDTRADLVNAASRAAHEAPWPSLAVAEDLEAQAGRLLTARLGS